MRVVVLAGSLPASEEPSRIERNGIAGRITSTPVATAANAAGLASASSPSSAPTRRTSSVLRSRPSRTALRSRRRNTKRPKKPSRAGNSVRAEITVNDTAIVAATATPYRKLTPSANMPSIAMHTIIPANRHCASGRVQRLGHRLLAAEAAQDALLVASDDEQRVVDADAQADQQRQLIGERRHVDHVREQADYPDPNAERHAGGQQRQQRRQQRAEHDEQHRGRGQETKQQAARVGALARALCATWPPT